MGKVFILGAGGMLGHKLCQSLAGHEVVGLVRKSTAAYEPFREDIFKRVTLTGPVDVLDDARLGAVIREARPHFVVNCIGLVKQLEEAANPYLAIAINALLPHRLAGLCDEIGARLIHISTDCVFDGARGSYREADITDAVDLYGRTKALGETLESESSAVTLRTSFIGREPSVRRHGLIEWFLSQNGGTVEGYANVLYSGLTAIELTRVIQRIIDTPTGLSGVHHVAGDPISKHDLLQLVKNAYGLNIDIRKVEEPRCDRTLIMGEPLSRLIGWTPPTWPDMIEQMYRDPTPYDAWSTGEESAR